LLRARQPMILLTEKLTLPLHAVELAAELETELAAELRVERGLEQGVGVEPEVVKLVLLALIIADNLQLVQVLVVPVKLIKQGKLVVIMFQAFVQDHLHGDAGYRLPMQVPVQK
jgi:hypothetical protein